ncbi:TPR end-of-group domain-containing protein [Leptospira santarosai]|uniref:TPR end-of-group domain-containing protein n=1 Tax=Leptospira santarosai TaxID=28183 RepID=UPI0002BF4867|nr:hypothetical protein [Leptospira santarosai]EMP01855.1 hypothetical protein LEP1GSC171_0992 [Leptospira santarosai str. HAI1380]KXZ31077.1 hypothetical protein AYB33_15450 [Leptospira santarosai]
MNFELNIRKPFFFQFVIAVSCLFLFESCRFVSIKESLRDYILTKSALNFNSYISRKEWKSAALVAHFFSMTASVLGIGNSTLDDFESGNTYFAREYFAGDLIFYSISAADNQFMPLVHQLTPAKIRDSTLAFNFACFHSIRGNKWKMLSYVEMALSLGKTVDEFEKDRDFNRFREDENFIRILRNHRNSHFKREVERKSFDWN